MFLSGNNMKKVVLGYSLDRNNPIAYTIQMMVGDVVFKHTCKKQTSILLHRHIAFHPWHKTDEVTKEANDYIGVSNKHVGYTLLNLSQHFGTGNIAPFRTS